MGRPVAYGQVGGPTDCYPVPCASYTSFNSYGGKFVCMISSYAYLVGTASVSNILGWANMGTVSTAVTNGDMVPVNFSDDAVYEMPLTTSYTETDLKSRIGMTCDVQVTSGVQYVNLASSTYDQVRIVGYRYYGSANGEQSALVKLVRYGMQTVTGVS